MSDKLLTTADLAQRLGLHTRSIMRWRAENKGPAYFKSGDGEKGRVFYKLSDVKKWEKEHNFIKQVR